MKTPKPTPAEQLEKLKTVCKKIVASIDKQFCKWPSLKEAEEFTNDQEEWISFNLKDLVEFYHIIKKMK